MAKYKAYPEYKDSGVEWLGEIPKHWVCTVLKRLCSLTTGLTPPTNNEDNYADEGHPWVRPEDINENGMETRASKYVSNNGWKLLRNIEPNSTLLCCIGTIGKCGYVREIVSTNQQITAATFRNSERFNFYLMQSARTQLEELATGNVLKILNSERLGTLNVVKVEGKEADTIAAFLDHETAKIDKLIEKQQQLIELLKEKRQAVISHAVTKGLNPDVPMKDSGVEWLGEVPAHWEVSKFGYISLVVRGGSPRPAGDPTLFNGDYSPWVTVAEITKDNEIYLESTDTFLTKKGSEQCRVFKVGTLLLSNSGATLGVPKILNINANANDGVVGFESLQIDHEYAYFYLSTLTNNLRESIKQGSGQPNLNTDIVKSIAVPIPPEKEIQLIVSSIKEIIKLYSLIESSALEQVKLLQERRTALISAAVTGKIDVRDWVAPDTHEVEVLQEVTA
ncbi:TPA: restriction endonuclease subunit S [Yersinia enterocolitica]|nr:restriction endonuclease subunit S [Yersinia enterocolitica]